MILTAWADGVGHNWTGFASLDVIRDFVGLADTYKEFAVLPLDDLMRKIRRGIKKRKAPQEVLSAERLGRPLGP